MLISCIAYLKDRGLEWRNVSLYGQEINQLSSAIGRMNLFLHGIEDFEIANDDTLQKIREIRKIEAMFADKKAELEQQLSRLEELSKKLSAVYNQTAANKI